MCMQHYSTELPSLWREDRFIPVINFCSFLIFLNCKIMHFKYIHKFIFNIVQCHCSIFWCFKNCFTILCTIAIACIFFVFEYTLEIQDPQEWYMRTLSQIWHRKEPLFCLLPLFFVLPKHKIFIHK